jgi:DNA repair exonuclease SbcCD ATPase subunit
MVKKERHIITERVFLFKQLTKTLKQAIEKIRNGENNITQEHERFLELWNKYEEKGLQDWTYTPATLKGLEAEIEYTETAIEFQNALQELWHLAQQDLEESIETKCLFVEETKKGGRWQKETKTDFRKDLKELQGDLQNSVAAYKRTLGQMMAISGSEEQIDLICTSLKTVLHTMEDLMGWVVLRMYTDIGDAIGNRHFVKVINRVLKKVYEKEPQETDIAVRELLDEIGKWYGRKSKK